MGRTIPSFRIALEMEKEDLVFNQNNNNNPVEVIKRYVREVFTFSTTPHIADDKEEEEAFIDYF